MKKFPGNPTDYETSLTWETLISILSYDPATGEFRWRDTRHGRVKIGQIAGNVDDRAYHGYRRIEINGRGFFASRLAWFYMTKEWPPSLVDHKNREPSDDRWENLRLATRKENGVNRGVRKDSKTGVNGVQQTPAGTWMVRCRIGNKRHYLGCFSNIEDAIKARQDFNVQNLGDFAPRAGAAK